MAIRLPAVAGAFYESDPARLRAQVEACFSANPEPAAREKLIGAVVPHAGLMYSGHVAAALYALADLPRRLIILCPNHTGVGHFAAINHEGAWRTPLGEMPVDTELATRLMKKCALLVEDRVAHASEHSLEVQLPFLQMLRDDFRFVPVCLGAPRYAMCEEIGNAIAETIAESDEPVAIIASSDLNHYEDQKTTLHKDQLAIDRVVALDPAGLWRTVEENDISMCGYIPATTMLIAAAKVGATSARLVKHATSGDVNRDYGHVVGYAAITVR